MLEITDQVGQLIRETRKAKGLTQKELSDKLGINVTTVNRYETGNQNLTIETLQKVLKALGKELYIDAK